jgi:hypothetical protein
VRRGRVSVWGGDCVSEEWVRRRRVTGVGRSVSGLGEGCVDEEKGCGVGEGKVEYRWESC